MDAVAIVERYAELHAKPAWRLAMGLMRSHPHDAADVVQQAFLSLARTAGRAPPDAPWPYFAALVINSARNAWRVGKRRQARMTPLEEHDAPDHRSTPPVEAAMSRETAAAVHAALAALPEDEREVISITHLAGLTHSEAAAALGIPLGTLKTRARRGAERLRQQLGPLMGTPADDTGSGPAPAITTALTALPFMDPPGGFAGAVTAWTTTAKASITAAAATTAAAGKAGAAGAIVMTNKAMLAAGLAAGLLIGGATMTVIHGSGNPPTPLPSAPAIDAAAPAGNGQRPGAAPAPTTQPTGERDQSAQLSRLTAERDEALRRESGLRDQLDAAERRLATLEANQPTPASEPRRLPVPVEDPKTQATLGLVDWPRLATAYRAYTDSQRAIHDTRSAGGAPSAEAVQRLRSAQSEYLLTMSGLATKDEGGFPSRAPGGGVRALTTHPAFTANLVASVVEAAGLPLPAADVDWLKGEIAVYNRDWERAADGYDEATPLMEKVLDEVVLKQVFLDRVTTRLSAGQLDALFAASTRGINGLDMLAPTTLMPSILGMTADARGSREMLIGWIADEAGVTKEQLGGTDQILDTWLSDLGDWLYPPGDSVSSNFRVMQGIVGARAQVRATRALMQLFQRGGPEWTRLRDMGGLMMPHIRKDGAAPGGATLPGSGPASGG